jgi:hypothetical protein
MSTAAKLPLSTPSNQENGLLTLAELARHLAVERSRVRRWLAKGMPYVQTPAQYRHASAKALEWRFQLADVVNWLAAGGAARRTW